MAEAIEGEAGIGKTTVWLEAVRAGQARGFQVLELRPAESEAQLSYVGLADLLDGVFDATRAALPNVQERAPAAALSREEADRAADPRTTAAAVVAVLAQLAASGPVLPTIDDVQWLDSASERALSFAARRLPPRVRPRWPQRPCRGRLRRRSPMPWRRPATGGRHWSKRRRGRPRQRWGTRPVLSPAPRLGRLRVGVGGEASRVARAPRGDRRKSRERAAIAAQLEDAAQEAAMRGAQETAAELFAASRRLTPSKQATKPHDARSARRPRYSSSAPGLSPNRSRPPSAGRCAARRRICSARWGGSAGARRRPGASKRR